MKKHSSANTLLIELVLVILFFMLCVATIVEMFGLARQKSAFARADSRAMLMVENLAEQLAGAEDAGAELEKSGFVVTENGWALQGEDYRILAAETAEAAGAGTLRTVRFTAEQLNGNALFELPVVTYLPGEVSP